MAHYTMSLLKEWRGYVTNTGNYIFYFCSYMELIKQNRLGNRVSVHLSLSPLVRGISVRRARRELLPSCSIWESVGRFWACSQHEVPHMARRADTGSYCACSGAVRVAC